MIVAGFGFRAGATADSMHDALSRALAALYTAPPAGPDTPVADCPRGSSLTNAGRADQPATDVHPAEHRPAYMQAADQRATDPCTAADHPTRNGPSADRPASPPPAAPDLLATAQAKAQSPAFQALARRLSRPLCAIPADLLAAQVTVTRSAAAMAAHGAGSVAESAALAAAGAGAHLLTPRVISSDRMATCALARGTGSPGAPPDTAPRPHTSPEGTP